MLATSSALARLAFATIAALALAGCQTLVREDAGGEWVTIPPGSALVLHQPIPVPAGRTRVFFVAGRLSSSSYASAPTCGLEVRRLDWERVQTIAAGRYPIEQVQHYWTLVSRLPVPSAVAWRLADYGADSDSGGNPMIREGYHLWLGGLVDPNLMRLTCLGLFDDAATAKPPTLTEMRAALGGLATIDIAD
ncbi:hypothetical protein ABC977_17210 [Thioalkalicoccus limnaeus]|uniref:Lipoprotein n=1 Tax=Thioalkalicoccus limnaeus TaxID=120681 RepID=A0ABV4BI07_9GAMM